MDVPATSGGEPRSEGSVLRQLIAHYATVAANADLRNRRGEARNGEGCPTASLAECGDVACFRCNERVARAARREAAALRRELRAIRLLGWDDPPYGR